MNEQQSRERVTQEIFKNSYKSMSRPRDPMAGEATPRDGSRYVRDMAISVSVL